MVALTADEPSRACSPVGRDDVPRLLGRDVALALLARSIEWDHASLAVVRLSMAVRTGAAVPAEHWRYCREAVASSRDPSLVALFRAAEFAAGGMPVPVPRASMAIIDDMNARGLVRRSARVANVSVAAHLRRLP